MKRSIITTADGSKTILIEDWKEQYHSKHGALQEAQYVFVQMGLQYLLDLKQPTTIRLLEIGFGTGLNAFLTAIEYVGFDISLVLIQFLGFTLPLMLIVLHFHQIKRYSMTATSSVTVLIERFD